MEYSFWFTTRTKEHFLKLLRDSSYHFLFVATPFFGLWKHEMSILTKQLVYLTVEIRGEQFRPLFQFVLSKFVAQPILHLYLSIIFSIFVVAFINRTRWWRFIRRYTRRCVYFYLLRAKLEIRLRAVASFVSCQLVTGIIRVSVKWLLNANDARVQDISYLYKNAAIKNWFSVHSHGPASHKIWEIWYI